MKRDHIEEQQYLQARKKVEKVSKFFKHLSVYIAVNLFLSAIFIIGDIEDGDTFNEAFFNIYNYKIWFYWGIGLLFQAISTFGLPVIFNRNWEERKLKKYLEEENKRK